MSILLMKQGHAISLEGSHTHLVYVKLFSVKVKMITHGGMFYKHTRRSQEFIKCCMMLGKLHMSWMELANLGLLLEKSITGDDDSASIWPIWILYMYFISFTMFSFYFSTVH